jgi:hypothetical protein
VCDRCAAAAARAERSKSRANGLYAEGLLGALECLGVCDVLTFPEQSCGSASRLKFGHA